jgi:hypothetical protein
LGAGSRRVFKDNLGYAARSYLKELNKTKSMKPRIWVVFFFKFKIDKLLVRIKKDSNNYNYKLKGIL